MSRGLFARLRARRTAERGAGSITVVPASPVSQVVDYPTAALVEGAKATQR